MNNFYQEKVLSVHHWTDTLFSFTTTRAPGFRFENGQFAMMGLPDVGGRPLLRAYSLVSPNYEETLEFFSIKVPDGPLTSRLQKVREGDIVLLSRKPTGTLLIDNLERGRNLYLFSTGTGLAPFLSIIRDPATYARFEKIVLVHGCRKVAELAYGEKIRDELPRDEHIGDLVRDQLIYYPTVTREPFRHQGRIPDLIASGQLFDDVDLPHLDPALDRVMLCGSPEMIATLRGILLDGGFVEGASERPGQFVVERAFVEK
ncbi:MAG: ferredoxin--NADP reductase [Beijerinckiaceae bacterium]